MAVTGNLGQIYHLTTGKTIRLLLQSAHAALPPPGSLWNLSCGYPLPESVSSCWLVWGALGLQPEVSILCPEACPLIPGCCPENSSD